MPARKLFLLLVAMMIAGATVFLARSNMSSPTGTTVAGPDVKANEILVASRDLPSGTILKEGDLKWQGWSAEIVPEGYALKGKADMADYIGGVVRYGLRLGEPVAANRVVKSSEKGFMAAVLAPGMRAVSVAITPTTGVAGFIFPGDHVDGILSRNVKVGSGETVQQIKISETILTDVRVLALDQKSDDQAKDPKVAQTATLEVTAKQAESLALVPEMGLLSLALRSLANPENPPAVPAQSLSDNNVTLEGDLSTAVSGPMNNKPRIQHIQIMRGKDTTESAFEMHP